MVAHVFTNGDEVLPDILNRSPPNNISVLIVGSGIGGLTTARECWRHGCNVRIFERQSEPVYTGDSFSIGISALRSLHNYPRLQKEVNDLGVSPRIAVYGFDGILRQGPLNMEDLLASSADRETVSNLLRLSRPQLYKTMLDHLGRLGVEVEYGRHVVDYFDDAITGFTGVTLADGSRHKANLVVAADGVNGHSSRLVLGNDIPAKPSGDAIYRVSYSRTILHDLPILDIFGRFEDNRPMVHMYAGERLTLSLGNYHDRIEWGLTHKDDGRAQESWNHHPQVTEVLELLQPHEGLPRQVLDLIKCTPQDKLINFRIMWRESQPQWTSANGCVVQLGDAAHTFHPASGNGATQAMEDAISLAACVALSGKDNIPRATRVHNLLRFERVSCLQAFGIINQAERTSGGKLPTFGRWILSHDPESYAFEKYQLALEHLHGGKPFENTNTPSGLVYRPWTIDSLLTERAKGEVSILSGDWS